MNIFNSLGSNYDFQFVLEALFPTNDNTAFVRLKAYLEDKYEGKVVLLYKGREAIELALRSLDLPKGAIVAFNGFTCYAVYKAVIIAGCGVEYIDIENLNLNFSPESLKATLKKNPAIKVLIIQNTLGYPCDIEAIARICKEHRIILIEDLAHSIGTTYKNSEAGTVGDFAVLSFSQDKIIDAISGGALIIRNKNYQNIDHQFKEVISKQQIIDKFYPFLTFLIRTTYGFYLGKLLHVVLKRFNLLSQPMSSQAGEGLHKLPNWYCDLIYKQFQRLENNLTQRKRIASIYAKNINSKALSDEIVEQVSSSSNLRFPIFTANRANLIKYLKEYGIYVSDIWYDAPIAPKKYMRLTNYSTQSPNSERLSSEILNLPTHKNISEKGARYISERINIWLKSQ